MKNRLYDMFNKIIGLFTNEEILKLAYSLIEYVKNDEIL